MYNVIKWFVSLRLLLVEPDMMHQLKHFSRQLSLIKVQEERRVARQLAKLLQKKRLEFSMRQPAIFYAFRPNQLVQVRETLERMFNEQHRPVLCLCVRYKQMNFHSEAFALQTIDQRQFRLPNLIDSRDLRSPDSMSSSMIASFPLDRSDAAEPPRSKSIQPSSTADKIRIESHYEREHELEAEKRNVLPPVVRTTVEGVVY